MSTFMITATLTLLVLICGCRAEKLEDWLDPECNLSKKLSKDQSEAVDQALKDADSTKNFIAMNAVHVELLQRSGGALNFCDIERRLRKLDAKTYLLALPLSKIAPPSKFSIVFPQPLFPTTSKIPKFSIWYELGGKDKAVERLVTSGLKPDDNLKNLNKTGVAIQADVIHQTLIVQGSTQVIAPDEKYRWLREKLIEYEQSGFLDDNYDVMLMYAVDDYLRKEKDIKFSINKNLNDATLKFYVIANDPDRLLSNSCTCVNYPETNIIVCDKKFLKAIYSWVRYNENYKPMSAVTALMNDSIADLLLYWIIGHEIGHFVHKDSADARFNQDIEQSADKYAFNGMPGYVLAWAHMSVNYIIQVLVRKITSENGGKIIVHENGIGHPNILARIYALKRAGLVVDFMLDKYEADTRFDANAGSSLPGICSLSPE